uniref:transmembrane protein 177 n=1 Tax=Doryrhamphus excisus TaxID=161450 RepID=UPI0025AE200E|nr:transmembrane protein 177 [Doryrhamphus excisus]XP_057938132.1 transmembrane protein 177 [Doryrhamphus excisus]XP_057938133.1 transmembrane protein 177 [Doryrhamphus excisus]XP_057938134.1 transmembrane protein 177 [Doryrhamphus excisus]XP_057938135.1 transmembrane protein 177 [Doryrhamphus excisus]
MASGFLKYVVLLQKYRTPLLIASCGGVFAANMFYHVFPDMSYRQLYQAWSKGEPVILSEKLVELFQQVLKDYGISSPKTFSAFASFGFHPVGAGVPWLPAGAHIGIPANFNSTVDDHSGITNRTIFINGKTVEWDSETGTSLKESLVFSRDAQKFAIAREVARLQSGAPVMSAAVAPFCLGGVWVYSVVLKQVFGLHAGPALLRGAVNVVALGLGAVSYFLTSDAVTKWTDYSSDQRAAGVSCDYARGGVEFYDKILSRNKTLRSLMGKKGEEMYAPSGNLFPAHLLQLKHTPYTSRKEGILTLLKKENI